jgi:hypothetical protein
MTGDRIPKDRPLALLVAFGYSLALGIATVTVPLVALAAGYDPAGVGFLVAIGSAAQLSTRLTLPTLLGRFPDRWLICAAAILMASGFILLLTSRALPVFVLAQVAVGASRAIFWTSSQTHAIRSGGSPVRRLVDLNLAGNAGTLSGPLLAGLLATIGLHVALLGGIAALTLSTVGAPFLQRFPPYDRRRSGGALQLLRRDGVDMAVWANVVGGVWWSMMGSYVPVILVGAGFGPSLVGLMVTLSEGAGAVTLLVLRRLPTHRVRPIVRAGALTEMAALAAVALAPPLLPQYGRLLITGGAGAGCVTTLAPALVALAGNEHEQADGLALSGTFRSVAQLAAPASISALLQVLALPVALAGLALTTAAPGLILGRPHGAPDTGRVAV